MTSPSPPAIRMSVYHQIQNHKKSSGHPNLLLHVLKITTLQKEEERAIIYIQTHNYSQLCY